MLGKLLGSSTRIINTPLDAVERLTGRESEEERSVSAPLEELAKALDDADKGWDEK